MRLKLLLVAGVTVALAAIGATLALRLRHTAPMQPAALPTARVFQANGRVRNIALAEKTVTVAHEAIPGFMPAMTMPLAVKNVSLLAGLQPGDEIHFELSVTDEDSWISNLEKIGGALASGNAATEADPASELRSGTLVPDFALTDENGKPLRLSDFRGKAVVLTFIYTRCPLPNFCPLMSKNFQEVQARFTRAFPGKFHLLSISIDPGFDTPEVLRGYAQIQKADGSVWSFCTGSEEQIDPIASTFGLVHEAESGLISHNLRTALIGADGRLIHLWKSNVWTPYEVQRMLEDAGFVVSSAAAPRNG